MHWYAHMMISDIVHREIKEIYNIKLDPKALKLGSVFPDYWPKYSTLKHIIETDLNLVAGMINELKKDRLPGDRKKLFQYSMKLGMVIHFLPDFFCYAHNSPIFDKYIEHTKYELGVIRKLKKINLKEVFGENFKKIMENENKRNIERYIKCNHNEYMSIPPSMEKDIYYSLIMSVSVASWILKGIRV